MSIDVNGFVTALEPFSGGTYILLAKHDTINAEAGMNGNGTTSMKRTVVAVDNAGEVLWSLDIN